MKLGLDIYRLDEASRWRLLQFFMGAPDTIIERWFESAKIKAMVAAHILPANYASLQQPGASLSMLHHAVGEIEGRKGAWGIVRGGMGAITQAMAASAREKGVTIRTGGTYRDYQRGSDGRAPCGWRAVRSAGGGCQHRSQTHFSHSVG